MSVTLMGTSRAQLDSGAMRHQSCKSVRAPQHARPSLTPALEDAEGAAGRLRVLSVWRLGTSRTTAKSSSRALA